MNGLVDIEYVEESSSVETETDTTVVASIGVDDLQAVKLDIIHANLFGSFLICGTLVGVFLFRRVFR